MQIDLLEVTVDVAATDLASAVSARTGRDLRRVEVSFDAPDSLVDALIDEIATAQRGDATIDGPEEEHWHVERSAYGYGDNGLCQFTVTLVEAETFAASVVDFDAFSLAPSYYRETHDVGRPLVITAEFDVTGQQQADLDDFVSAARLNRAYFDVVRHGVTETAVRMRLGRCVWQRIDEAARRHQLEFISEEGDAELTPNLVNEPTLTNASRIAVAVKETTVALLDELIAAGALTVEAAARIRTRTEEASRRHLSELDETSDVSMFR